MTRKDIAMDSLDSGPVMLHDFLDANSARLIETCRAKVATRAAPRPTEKEMQHGIPLFLRQLIETLRIEHAARDARALQQGPQAEASSSELEATATRHGQELLQQGYTVDQVVHDYGDLCQAVTELAMREEAALSSSDFGTMNRCLDIAIATAVTEFARERDVNSTAIETRAAGERLGFLAHELRNFLHTATLSFAAIKAGTAPVAGATAAVLDRSLAGLGTIIDRALADVRLSADMPPRLDRVGVGRLVDEVRVAATLEAKARGCGFTVSPVEPGLAIQVDRQLIFSALSNLLHNAFKFTRAHSHVSLRAYGSGDRVRFEVEDQCGGLPEGKAEALFKSFAQHGADRSGVGLGLSIARRAVEACGGTLAVRDMPGVGCVFTVDLPRFAQVPLAA